MDMKAKHSGKSIGTLVVAAALIAFLLFFAWIFYVKPKMADILFEPVFVNDVKKIRLVSEMRVKLNASVEAEKSAVLAETDEASRAYADQALSLSAAVEEARSELGVLIEAEKMGKEVDLFREFSTCWERFRQIDQELLPLSVLNTNLKAYELSYDSAQKAVNQLEEALNSLMNSGAPIDKSCRITRLAMRTLVAVLKIHALQSPHIAESRQAKMDEIETTMRAQNALVNESLDALSFLMNPKAKPLIDAATAAYAEFWRINTEVMNLSRQNSNVRSLALSLGQKRNTSVQCQDALEALEKAIQSKVYKATR
jgi:hypothetical protein